MNINLCLLSVASSSRFVPPQDKRIVDEPSSSDKIWWGKINIPMTEHAYTICRERALDYLNIQERLYVVDAFAGWDAMYKIKVRKM